MSVATLLLGSVLACTPARLAGSLDAACLARLGETESELKTRVMGWYKSAPLVAFGSARSLRVPRAADGSAQAAYDDFEAMTGFRPAAFIPRSRQQASDAAPAPGTVFGWPYSLEAAAGLVIGQLILASEALENNLPLKSLTFANLRSLESYELITLVLGVLIGGTFILALLDRLLLQERLLAAVALLVPARRQRTLSHEAGHFLCAYLLGLPVRQCRPSPQPFDLRASPRAATVYYSPAMAAKQAGEQATSVDVERASIVLCGGIAAEALLNGSAEGGAADERALRALLIAHHAPRALSEAELAGRARWAAANALLLLRDERILYDTLCDALRDGATVGECVSAIEAAAATAVPASAEFQSATGAAPTCTPASTQTRTTGSDAPLATEEGAPPPLGMR